MAQLREGYLQIHPSRLAALLALADNNTKNGNGSRDEYNTLSDVRRHVRNKNQAYMASHNPDTIDNRHVIDKPSHWHSELLRKQHEAAEVRRLVKNTGRKIKVRWNGNMREVLITGRYYRCKAFIVGNVLAIPSSPSFGNMSIDETANAEVKRARIHLSIIERDEDDSFKFYD